MTIGLLRAIAERGLTVPDDIALVAFDDFEWADLFAPRLTVIRQPTTELGSRAVELLLSRLEDPSRPPRQERLEAMFVHRNSCGCTAPSPAAQVASATLKAMTTSPRELGITTLLFSIYVSARGGAQVAGAARRLLR